MMFQKTSPQAFFGASALLFAATASLTIMWCGSISAMGAMSMPGGWAMSMAWMPMPGQTWLAAMAAFAGMWVVMMVAMMLPSLLPTLWRYRQLVGSTSETRLNSLTALVGIAYYFVWSALGIVIFPLGAALAEIEMRRPALARLVPLAVGVVVVIAGGFQFTASKARHLACCRDLSGHNRTLPTGLATAWQHGLRLGLHCIYGCAGFTAILLAFGLMDLRVMAFVTAAVTAERLAPNGERIARAIGITAIGIGLLLMVRAAAGLA